MQLTDSQWAAVELHIPTRERRARKRAGRPWQPARDVLNACLWILKTGAPWNELPGKYLPYQTVHRRYQRWVQGGVFDKVLEALAEHLAVEGKLDLTEGFIDGTHAGAKRGSSGWCHTTRQGDQDHGSGRPQRSSCRRRDCER